MNLTVNPPVTIGLGVYNGADFIEQALQGIVDQTYRNWQLIVSDNASTDNTWSILEKWAAMDKRIVLHRQPENVGAPRNFRHLLDVAETEFFLWHAHDDWIAPNYLEELVAILCAEPKCTLACPQAIAVDLAGQTLRTDPFPDLPQTSRLGRIRTLLRNSEPTRFYGLYRRPALLASMHKPGEFGYLWAVDNVLLLDFVLADGMRGTNATRFYSRRTGVSDSTLRPKGLRNEARFLLRWLRFHVRALAEAELSFGEKVACLPALLAHARDRSGIRLTKPYRHFVKKPLARFRRRPAGPANS